MKKSVFKSKKFKYGGSAVALTVIVIALVLILNVVVTSLAATNSWYSDLTGASIYSISDAFEKELDKILNPEGGEKKYVNIVIMMDEDRFSVNSAYANYVYHTIKQIEKKFDNVRLVSKDIVKNPEEKTRYQLNEADAIYTTDVAIELADANGNPVIDRAPKRYSLENFFTWMSSTNESTGQTTKNIYAYNAEVAFLSAISRLVNFADRPTAYYLQGHGEPTLEQASDWVDLLDKIGYNVKAINLSYEDFPYESGTKHNSDVLIINAPIYDLLAPTSENPDMVSEAKKIREFLQTNYGNLIVMENSSTPKLHALEELLSEWNLGYGSSVTDNAHSVSGSNGVKIFADYSELNAKNIMARGLLSRIIDTKTSESYPDAIFDSAKAVIVKNDENGDGMSDTRTNNADGQLVALESGDHGTYALLPSYKTAECNGEKGSVALAAFSRVVWDKNDTNGTYSCVFCFGSSNFVDPQIPINNSIMNMVFSYINRNESVSYDNIGMKKFDANGLSVSTSAATAWTVVCVAVLPVLIIAAGTFVWIRRRHS